MDTPSSSSSHQSSVPFVRSKRRVPPSIQLKGDIPPSHQPVSPPVREDPFALYDDDSDDDAVSDDDNITSMESSDDEDAEEKTVNIQTWTVVPHEFTLPPFVLVADASHTAS